MPLLALHPNKKAASYRGRFSMGKGGTGVIKKYNEIYRSRKTFERSLCHVLSGQKVSPLPNFSIAFEYYSTCCSDIRCDQFLLRKREEGRKGERRVIHCTAARYLKVERGCYDERELERTNGYFCLFRFLFFSSSFSLLLL